MFELLFDQYKNASTTQIVLEFLAFVFGIASVFYAKKENILVYPTGLVTTVITVYLLYQAKYFADMTMNIYYSAYMLDDIEGYSKDDMLERADEIQKEYGY